jgi:O-acetyl-ADP-ribose deacetylase (regulator of RNase III)
MFHYATGNLLLSDAKALVNPVNCEGVMGKGLAYQFKIKYPKNNHEYVKACRSGKLTIGNGLLYPENDKLIYNFPTKDKWREKSQYDYIKLGLIDLSKKIIEHKILSISIPPLGCGNGGLEWGKVNEIITGVLSDATKKSRIIIFKPSVNYLFTGKMKPILNIYHLVLMDFKLGLKYFNLNILLKCVEYFNISMGDKYFLTDTDKMCKNIKQYQEYFGVGTREAREILYRELISKRFLEEYKRLSDKIKNTIANIE